jgi:hypothetical protein
VEGVRECVSADEAAIRAILDEAFIRQHDAIFATSMRLLQVLTSRGTALKIVAYHNVDVKPGVEVPEPGAK